LRLQIASIEDVAAPGSLERRAPRPLELGLRRHRLSGEMLCAYD
jgi:hypothetical protein